MSDVKSFLWLALKVATAIVAVRTVAGIVPGVGPVVNKALDRGLLG